MPYKITVDTGGTFTDVVISDAEGRLTIGKAPTRQRAFEGVRGGLAIAAEELGLTVGQLLADTNVFVYSTTRATNAILEGKTARTAFLTTAGFPDTLMLREGGKLNPFDLGIPYPEPYVPRRLTFEIPERISAEGEVVTPLDESAVSALLSTFPSKGIEAVAVCLLWSVANGAHEVRIGELIEELLPDASYTLSHLVNPIVREYRRASSAAIDASLKPLMGAHLLAIAGDLQGEGFDGELMVATSMGGALHLEDVASRPIETVRSGPAAAPVAGKVFAETEGIQSDVIVCDTGGTSFDVSLIRDGAVSYSRDTWLGGTYTGHLTGTSSVDIRSIGSGGGSIAWVDSGGLLRVGPESAGADPGPAAYGRGGTKPTVSDAALVLGYLDPDTFLGGRMQLDRDAAAIVLEGLANELSVGSEQAAEAVMTIANEHMVGAIQDITINEGIDPRDTLVVAGGGAAGLGIVSIGRHLGCRSILVPRVAGALSAAGAQFSDIVAEFSVAQFADSSAFDFETVNAALAELDRQADAFADGLRIRGVSEMSVDYFVDARYAHQVWQLEVPLAGARLGGPDDIQELSERFGDVHERVFAVREPGAPVEVLTWKARLRAPVGRQAIEALAAGTNGGDGSVPDPRLERDAFFDGSWLPTPRFIGGTIGAGVEVDGPAIIEEPTSTLVIPPGARLRASVLGNYQVEV